MSRSLTILSAAGGLQNPIHKMIFLRQTNYKSENKIGFLGEILAIWI